MNKNLIVLSGKKRVGKDTVANLFNDYTQRKYALRAFAEPVKEIVSQAVCMCKCHSFSNNYIKKL